MVRSFRLFARTQFTRSRSLDGVNAALREAQLLPERFPEGLRLALVLIAKESVGLSPAGEPTERAPLDEALRRAGRLFAYCCLGPQGWKLRFKDGALQERLLLLAAERPEELEGRVVSLALLSGNAHSGIAARFEIESG